MGLHRTFVFLTVATAITGFIACSGSDNPPPNNDDDTSSSGAGAAQPSSTGSTGSSMTTTVSSGAGGALTCATEYTNITGDCDLLTGGCDPGQHCVPIGSGEDIIAQCQPSSGGQKGPGEPCGSDQECQDGALCQSDLCRPFCCPDTNQPCAGGECNLELSFTDTDKYVMVCSYSATCTLLDPTSCPDGLDCHATNFETGIAVCNPPSPQQGDPPNPCEYINDCGDSQFCDNNVDPAVCAWHCDVTTWQNEPAPALGLGGCPENTECVAPSNWTGFPNLGACLAPAE